MFVVLVVVDGVVVVEVVDVVCVDVACVVYMVFWQCCCWCRFCVVVGDVGGVVVVVVNDVWC